MTEKVVDRSANETPKTSKDNHKYEFTDEHITVVINGETHTLYRIRATKDIIDESGNVIAKKGDLGGFIEKEENLDYHSNAWVSDNAMVFGDAKVTDSALVCENAKVYGYAWVSGYARVSGNALVFEYARVSGHAKIQENAQVFGRSFVGGNALISGNAQVSGDATVTGDAVVTDDAIITKNAWVSGSAFINVRKTINGYRCVTGTTRDVFSLLRSDNSKNNAFRNVLRGSKDNDSYEVINI